MINNDSHKICGVKAFLGVCGLFCINQRFSLAPLLYFVCHFCSGLYFRLPSEECSTQCGSVSFIQLGAAQNSVADPVMLPPISICRAEARIIQYIELHGFLASQHL